jgi:hypothetical protein
MAKRTKYDSSGEQAFGKWLEAFTEYRNAKLMHEELTTVVAAEEIDLDEDLD